MNHFRSQYSISKMPSYIKGINRKKMQIQRCLTVCSCHVTCAFESWPGQASGEASLAKWLSVRLRTKWFWVRVQLQSLHQRCLLSVQNQQEKCEINFLNLFKGNNKRHQNDDFAMISVTLMSHCCQTLL